MLNMESEQMQTSLPGQLKREKMPNHVAIIMDGNGRWAKKRNRPRVFGHRQGLETMRNIVKQSDILGIKVLTVFGFSEENWGRPQYEISVLMTLMNTYLMREREELNDRNVQLRVMGRIERLPAKTQEILSETQDYLSDNTGMVLNVAISYGARTEILDACRALAERVASGDINPEDINEKTMESAMHPWEIPDPDLLIRTSGEQRISNFLLWQAAYSELYFTEKAWPEFDTAEYIVALEEFQRRQRRFGLVVDEPSVASPVNENRNEILPC
jgi:undecaprenyl diphosphate synthase